MSTAEMSNAKCQMCNAMFLSRSHLSASVSPMATSHIRKTCDVSVAAVVTCINLGNAEIGLTQNIHFVIDLSLPPSCSYFTSVLIRALR